MIFNRYAIYVAPPPAAMWTRACTAWLGWNMESGQTVPHPQIADLDVGEITTTPRKYGLHGTLKPPFRLAPGIEDEALAKACADLCQGLSPVTLDGLAVTRLGRFLALCPVTRSEPLSRLAATCVEALDRFRAPQTEAELTKRRARSLIPAQEVNLTRWGYPYVMDQFRFHITLTGQLAKADLAPVQTALQAHIGPLLPTRYVIRDLALVGEDDAGRFHLIHRYALSG